MPALPVDSTTEDLTVADGTRLTLRRWPLPEPASRGTVLIVHGLGEHSGRYEQVATSLREWGWLPVSYDQRGHGNSQGPRGGLKQPRDLLTDLAEVYDAIHPSRSEPLVLLGHSMGGVVAARFVADELRPVQGLILSSPALDAGLSAFQRLQLPIARVLVPNLRLPNGLGPDFLSRDPAVVQAYRGDPFVHNKITPRLAHFIVDSGAHVRERAARWPVPTLLLWSGADRLVGAAGSAEFAARAPKTMVEAHCFERHYHELFNELEREQVFAVLRAWLEQLDSRGSNSPTER
jgi:alpha-beta hydrolase superfamily lysophospholipase